MRNSLRIKPFMDWLTMEWEKSPDYRFGQLLINLGLVTDDIKTWNTDIVDYNFSHDIEREIRLWGTSGKNGDEEIKYILIKDLDTNHIKKILNTQKHISGTKIEKTLKNELKFRNNKK